MTADQLSVSNTATIETLQESPLKVNLMELGFLPGKKITLKHIAPGNGPMAFRLDETLLALRKEEAAIIQVKIV
ncbi:FeoA family protein [Algoriphagus limi]|uniref:Ferrous iron transport protein A n=1 Tax=Algoriphagus limi TaxID=2975273 RepID=A0ABT2G4G6_9BACT|nr:FeoA family protein [Algoriphagus limi]MCS5489336.1 ferrous iron transport protein A [Algoriphagus limi]